MSDSGAEETPGIFAQLTLAGVGPFDARIASLGEGGITLCYLRTLGPVPENGQRGDVVIVGDQDGEPHEAVVHVEGWHGDGAVYVVSFRYRDVDHLESLVQTGVHKHVAMRAAFRVSPAPGEDIPVVVHKDERSYSAHLVDVSAKGIGLSLDGTDRLSPGEEVAMDLNLPDGVEITALQARICFAGERDGHPCHGLEFVVRDTASSQRAVAQVVTYVMRRQREMLTRPEERTETEPTPADAPPTHRVEAGGSGGVQKVVQNILVALVVFGVVAWTFTTDLIPQSDIRSAAASTEAAWSAHHDAPGPIVRYCCKVHCARDNSVDPYAILWSGADLKCHLMTPRDRECFSRCLGSYGYPAHRPSP